MNERTKALNNFLSTVRSANIRMMRAEDDSSIDIPITNDKWVYDEVTGFSQRLCSLDQEDDFNITVINVKVKPGGYLPPHRHQSEEHVYVVAGSYTDPVNKQTFNIGDVQTIPPLTLHASESHDGCLLLVTWQPPFPTTIREAQY